MSLRPQISVGARRALFAFALLVSGGAAAAPKVLDPNSGALGGMKDATTTIAWSCFFFALVLGLLVEAFGSSPLQQRDYSGVLWRAVVVFFLLTFYPRVFGPQGLLGLAGQLSNRIAPASVWEAYTSAQTKQFDLLDKERRKEEAESAGQGGGLGSSILNSAEYAGEAIGGILFDSLLSILLLIGQAANWVLVTVSRVLALLFYILGPLALVFSIPRGSGAGGRWLRSYINVLLWPMLSGLLLSIILSSGLAGMEGKTPVFASVATSLLLTVVALAVPMLATGLVGGGVSVISGGMSEGKGLAKGAAGAVTSAGAAVSGGGAGLAVAAGAPLNDDAAPHLAAVPSDRGAAPAANDV